MTEREGFDKEVVELPDGRRLVYYRFADGPPRPEPAQPAVDPHKATRPKEG